MMKSLRQKIVIIFVLVGCLVIYTPMNSLIAAANVNSQLNTQPLQIVSSSISPQTIVYYGNLTPSYLNVTVITNKQTDIRLVILGTAISPISLAPFSQNQNTYTFRWMPAVGVAPIPAGEYPVAIEGAYDLNHQYIPLGKIVVVNKSALNPLIEQINPNPPIIAPKYKSEAPLTTVKYQLNRHAKVKIALIGRETVTELPAESLSPGVCQFTWNGRDDKGRIVPDGDYKLEFTAEELEYIGINRIFTTTAAITVKGGEYEIPDYRLREIITGGGFSDTVITPNGDGVQDTVEATITLAEKANITVFVTTEVGSGVKILVLEKEYDPGTHSFTWDGYGEWEGKAPNGLYRLKVSVLDAKGACGYMTIPGAEVRVKDSYQIIVPEPVQKVKVIAESTTMSVSPMGQQHVYKKGDTFPLIGYNFGYEVLLAEGITGNVALADVELTDLDSIPVKTGRANVDIDATKDLSNQQYSIVEQIPSGTCVRILRQDLNKYRVLLPSGKQGYVKTTDLIPLDFDEVPYTASGTDSIYKIAAKFGTTKEALAQYNNLDPNERLTYGQVILIPASLVKPPQHDYAKDKALVSKCREYAAYDITDHWAEKCIRDLMYADVVKGYLDTAYHDPEIFIKPDNPITRAEFVTLLVKAMGLGAQPHKIVFNDVLSSDWYYEPINTAASLGIVSGVSKTRVEPNRNITRQEICALIVRAFGNTVSFNGNPKRFTDVTYNWAKPYIDKASAAGIVNGYNDGSFKQMELATRAEAMVMISGALKLEKTSLPADSVLINTILNNLKGEYQALHDYDFDGIASVTDRYQTGYYKAEEDIDANTIKGLVEKGVIFDLTLKGDSPLTPRTNLPLQYNPDLDKWISEGAAVPSVKIISKSNQYAKVELTGAEYYLASRFDNHTGGGVQIARGTLYLKKTSGSQWKIYNADRPEGYYLNAYLFELLGASLYDLSASEHVLD